MSCRRGTTGRTDPRGRPASEGEPSPVARAELPILDWPHRAGSTMIPGSEEK
jgi:hypothetical protein